MSGVFSRNSLEHAVAGSAATILAQLLLFPLDLIKTLLQVESERASGWRDILLRVLREEGARGLYRGCAPMLQTVGVSQFLYFWLFEGLKEPLAIATGQPDGVVGPYETLMSSALAGALNMVVTEPLWRACVIAQAHSRSGSEPPSPVAVQRRVRGVFGTVLRMWAVEGPSALWRGLGTSLWLVTNPVIQFFVYDLLKAVRLSSHDQVSTADAFVMGALAKALATLVTFPLQVAQANLRAAREGRGGQAALGPASRGMVACLRHKLDENGLLGLYIGLWPKLVQTVSQAAFMFAFYEKIHWFIRQVSRKGLRRSRSWRGRQRLRT